MKFGEHRRPGDFLCVYEAPITIQRVGIIFSYNDIANSVPLATAVQLPPSFLVVLVPFGTPYLIHARIIYARVDTIFCLYEHGNQPFWTLSTDDVTLPNLNCLTEGGFEFSFPIE